MKDDQPAQPPLRFAGRGIPGRSLALVAGFPRLVQQQLPIWYPKLKRSGAALGGLLLQVTRYRLPIWLVSLIGLLGAVLLTLKRPNVQATVPLSKVQFTVRQELRLRPVLTSALTTLQLSHFEKLNIGAANCNSASNGVVTLTVPRGGLQAFSTGVGKWTIGVSGRDAPSRGAFRLVLQESSSLTEVYVDTTAGLTGTLKVENCRGYEHDGNLPLGERLTVYVGAKKEQRLEVYASYEDPATVPLFSDVCVDELSGSVASEWQLQREYWETCVLSSNTKLSEFALRANANCPPPERSPLRDEKGGIRLRELRLDKKGVEAVFRWPKEAAWDPELDAACTFTFWTALLDWWKK